MTAKYNANDNNFTIYIILQIEWIIFCRHLTIYRLSDMTRTTLVRTRYVHMICHSTSPSRFEGIAPMPISFLTWQNAYLLKLNYSDYVAYIPNNNNYNNIQGDWNFMLHQIVNMLRATRYSLCRYNLPILCIVRLFPSSPMFVSWVGFNIFFKAIYFFYQRLSDRTYNKY